MYEINFTVQKILSTKAAFTSAFTVYEKGPENDDVWPFSLLKRIFNFMLVYLEKGTEVKYLLHAA